MTEYRAIIEDKTADPMGYDPLIVDSDNLLLWAESVNRILAGDPDLVVRRFKKVKKHYEPYEV